MVDTFRDFTGGLLRDINARPNVDFANFGFVSIGDTIEFAGGGLEAPFLFGGESFAPRPETSQKKPVSILDAILDTAKDAGQLILRAIIPDPLEAVAEVFFPDVARQVLGPRRIFGGIGGVPGPPTPAGTPPFFPSPLEPQPGEPPSIFGQIVIPEAPGIFDDIVRGLLDVIPELIPGFPEIDVSPGAEVFGDVTFEDVGREFPQIFEPFESPPLDIGTTLEGFPIEGGFGEVQEDDMAEDDLSGVCPPRQRLPQCITFAQWNALGRPEGYTADRGGFLRKRRTRRKRPLSQQAKDDLAWAKATFGGGKAFDNVVARMRL